MGDAVRTCCFDPFQYSWLDHHQHAGPKLAMYRITAHNRARIARRRKHRLSQSNVIGPRRFGSASLMRKFYLAGLENGRLHDVDVTAFALVGQRIGAGLFGPRNLIDLDVIAGQLAPRLDWVGTNDTGATASNPAGSGPPNNMVQVTGIVYDGGLAGGDSNVTQRTDYVDSTGLNDRVTTFLYDFRNRQTDTDGEIDFYAKQYFDNLDRITKNERYNTSLSGNLIMRSTTNWDDRHAPFQTTRYAVDPTTGIVGDSLVDNTWRDASRNIVKSLPAGS
jgi:hypothetical protein